jgi:hypothetical protein
VFKWLSKLKNRSDRSISRQHGLGSKLSCESLEDRTTPTVSMISSSFNGTGIPTGDYVWFSSVATISGAGSTPVTVNVSDQTIDFTSGGTSYSLSVPDSTIVLDPAITTASTTFGANGWSVSAPSNFNGNVFVSGLGWQATNGLEGSPVDNLLTGLGGQGIGGLAGSLNNLLSGLGGQATSNLTSGSVNNITWTGDFSTNAPGISVSWEWAAAVYKNFSPNESAIQVKTASNSQIDTFQNSDPAGTPENFKSFVTGGARGNGGTNWTGTETNATTVQPEVVQPTGTASISGNVQYSMFGGDEVGSVVGATVTLTDANGNVVATTFTDSNGNYSFGSLAAGNYTVTVTDSSYDAQSNTVTLTDGQAATDNFTET